MITLLDNPFVAAALLDSELRIQSLNSLAIQFVDDKIASRLNGQKLSNCFSGCDSYKWTSLVSESLKTGMTFDLTLKNRSQYPRRYRFFARPTQDKSLPEIVVFFIKIDHLQMDLQLEMQMMNIALDRKSYELSLFRDLLGQIKQIQNYDEVVSTFMKFICENFLLGHAMFVKIFKEGEFRVHVSNSFSLLDSPNLEGLRVRVNSLTDDPSTNLSPTQQYWTQGIPQIHHELFHIEGKELTGVLHLPIKFGDELLGILYFGHYAPHHGLKQEDVEFISLLLQQIDPFIESAKHFEMSMLDDLTQVFNKRYFKLTAERELKKGLINPDLKMNLILLDIDHFKKVNDTYGHVAGDHALKTLGEILKRCSRKHDFVCRYGGEEFAILLHESPEVAVLLAERIKNRLHKTTMSFGLDIEYHMTASFGIAAFDPTQTKLEDWIERADQALYEAKRTGRDRIVVAP